MLFYKTSMQSFEQFKASQLFESHWNMAKSIYIRAFFNDNFIYQKTMMFHSNKDFQVLKINEDGG